jgi:lysophospholipase L1-like esterase
MKLTSVAKKKTAVSVLFVFGCALGLLTLGHIENSYSQDLLSAKTDPAPTVSRTPEPTPAADLPPPLLFDVNGNGSINIAAFGDSITRGVGDFNAVGDDVEHATTPSGEAGYPLRVERLLSIPVHNLGDPGERLSTQGLLRFAEIIPSLAPDFVAIGGGTNDALDQIYSSDFYRSVQTMINIAKAFNIEPILVTAPPACCGRTSLNPFLQAYNNEMRTLAVVNEIPVADVYHAYENTCRISSCHLLNQPEGVHPNTEGYDVSGEVVTATLLQINIFDPTGPSLLEQALSLPTGTIATVPDPAPPAAQ